LIEAKKKQEKKIALKKTLEKKRNSDREEKKKSEMADEPPKEMVDDPLKVVSDNEMHRRRSPRRGRGLYTVDEWAALFPRGYTNRVATFAPERWPTATALKQEQYTNLFSSEFPEVQRVLLSVPGVCVAGGAAAWPFLRHDSRDGDVDLFVYANDSRSLMLKADEVARKMRAEFADATMSEALAPGLITFLIWRRDGECSKVQLILRDYRDMDELLHGFDVGSCCVGFDGTTTFLTGLGMFSLLHRVNIVSPMYRSITYEPRLKKYFDRGVAMAFPHLRDGALVAGSTLALPHMKLHPRFVRGRLAVGTVTTGVSEKVSDYDCSLRQWLRASSWHKIRVGITKKNIALIASGRSDFLVLGATLPYAAYAESPPTLEIVLPVRMFEQYIDGAVGAVVTKKGLVNVGCLRRLFGLSDAQLSAFTVAACDALRSGAGVDASGALAPFRAALLDKYRAAAARTIEWCIVVDPQRQYTASRNPTPESDAAWYGDALFSETPPPVSLDESMCAVFGRLEARELPAVGAEVCALCQYDVTRSNNSVTLGCGHTFHFGKESGCKGFLTWAITLKRTTCPMCRQVFSSFHSGRSSARAARELVRVEVDWPA
jgi:hypothetical protein